MASKILIDIDLNDAVTLDQFQGMIGYIRAALSQFQHLIKNVQITSTPPSAIEMSLTVTVTGMPQENVQQDVLTKVADALKSTNGVQYHVQVAGSQQETLPKVTAPVTEHVKLTAPHIP